jgi:hypothetical protein
VVTEEDPDVLNLDLNQHVSSTKNNIFFNVVIHVASTTILDSNPFLRLDVTKNLLGTC